MTSTTNPAAEFPEIVCLCGSTRFMDAYNEARKRLTLEGKIVLSVEIVTYDAATDPQIHDPETKAMLDELHLRKIDLADRVHILNVPTEDMPGGYVGESTLNEIAYAKEQGKVITWLTSTTNPAADIKALCDRAEERHHPDKHEWWWTGDDPQRRVMVCVHCHERVPCPTYQLAAALRDMEAAVDYTLDVLDSEGYVKDARHVRGLLHSAAAAAVRHIEGGE